MQPTTLLITFTPICVQLLNEFITVPGCWDYLRAILSLIRFKTTNTYSHLEGAQGSLS